jgi:DnaJ-class molecular chaperone
VRPSSEISAAFATLSDAEKRQNYDAYGHEDGAAAAQAQGGGVYGNAHMYHGQHMTPEDLFEMFFSGDGFVRMNGGARQRGMHFYRCVCVTGGK